MNKWKRYFNIARLFYYLAKISKNPNATDAVWGVVRALRGLHLLQDEHDWLTQQSENRETFSKRKMLQKYDLHSMRQLPANSLGRLYADHMFDNNLQPDFYEEIEVKTDSDYIVMRMRETHDFWHVMTGFDTSVEGEIGVQAFMMAQIRSPLSPLLIGGQLVINAIKDPQRARKIMSAAAQGWQKGLNAKSIFSVDWENHFSTPITNLRTDYNI
jgi:ubiquinone biosynthesis protein Coq4